MGYTLIDMKKEEGQWKSREGKLFPSPHRSASFPIAIVICKAYQNRHIGRAVVGKILELAREKGYPECFAEIYSFNAQSQAMFRSIGFVQKDAEMFVYPLR